MKTVEAVSDEVLPGSRQTPKTRFRAGRSSPTRASWIYTLNALKRAWNSGSSKSHALRFASPSSLRRFHFNPAVPLFTRYGEAWDALDCSAVHRKRESINDTGYKKKKRSDSTLRRVEIQTEIKGICCFFLLDSTSIFNPKEKDHVRSVWRLCAVESNAEEASSRGFFLQEQSDVFVETFRWMVACQRTERARGSCLRA